MKNTINKYFVIGLLSVGIVACDPGDFGDLNVNPNETTTPIAAALLTNAINSLDETITATTGQHYVQYLANSQYTDDDTYQTVRFSYNGFYSGAMNDLAKIIELNTNEATKEAVTQYGSNENQIAVARILLSYYYLHLTDRWGDIPYTEALRLEDDILQPAFDTQQDIYNSLFTVLDQAEAAISGTNPVVGDILFDGDMDRWKEFANTIRLTAALRLSEVDATKGEAEFNAALNDGVIELDNSANIYYTHLADEVYDNVWEDRFFTRRDYALAETLVDAMQSLANGGVLTAMMDPRLPVYADPTENGNMYVGMKYGITQAEAGSISNSDVSFLGTSLRMQDSPTYIYTAAQVAFARAEAALLGWTTEDAETLYETGIELSIKQYTDASDVTITAYLTDPWVAYDPATAREQILTQKWIANFLNGYEAWADWRRTGFPVLTPAVAAQNQSGEIPVRQAYPTSARDLNGENYDAVIARQGEDGLDTHVWWDVD